MNIALVGNPNVGKSVVSNVLTGKYVTVSNYPGTTVEVAKGAGKFGGKRYTVIDTPGVNSLIPHSEDERVTRDILSKGDVTCIVQVADSKNMKRSLLLTLELLRLKIPIVLDLNMSDEAKERGIRVDTKLLSKRLGIEVVETVATTGEGISRLKEAVLKVRVSDHVPEIAEHKTGTEEDARKTTMLIQKSGRIVDGILKEVLSVSKPLKSSVSETISRIVMRPVTGIPILLMILYIMYKFVGQFAAGTCVDFVEERIFGKALNPIAIKLADKFIPIAIAREFLVGDYGVITMAFTYAFAIIFPIVTAFFLFFGVLEDTGYLPRLSILSDRIFRIMGLNGRAILPIVLGLGCGTMATLTSRILDTKKERIIVSLLLALAIPCSAQLGVIMGLLGNLSAKAAMIWFGVVLGVMIMVGFAASRIVPGARSPFVQEIPPIRMPQMSNIIIKTLARLRWYLKEAVPLFVLGTVILFVLDKISLLKAVEHLFSPLIVGFLGLPEKATEAFIIGFLRRDYGAAGLYALSKAGDLNDIQILVSIVTITLFVPCIAQFFVTVKERGVKAGSLIGAFVFLFAFCVGGLLNFTLRYLAMRGIAVI